MQLSFDRGTGHHIDKYSDQGIEIKGTSYNQTVIVTPNVINTLLTAVTMDAITPEELTQILELKPEIVIFGGHTAQIAPPHISGYFLEKRIGFECMTMGAACRTYNVLMAEGRNVVAILFTQS